VVNRQEVISLVPAYSCNGLTGFVVLFLAENRVPSPGSSDEWIGIG